MQVALHWKQNAVPGEERSAWNEERKSIVDRMFHLNMSKTTICEVTGFSEAEVNAIIHEASAEGDIH